MTRIILIFVLFTVATCQSKGKLLWNQHSDAHLYQNLGILPYLERNKAMIIPGYPHNEAMPITLTNYNYLSGDVIWNEDMENVEHPIGIGMQCRKTNTNRDIKSDCFTISQMYKSQRMIIQGWDAYNDLKWTKDIPGAESIIDAGRTNILTVSDDGSYLAILYTVISNRSRTYLEVLDGNGNQLYDDIDLELNQDLNYQTLGTIRNGFLFFGVNGDVKYVAVLDLKSGTMRSCIKAGNYFYKGGDISPDADLIAIGDGSKLSLLKWNNDEYSNVWDYQESENVLVSNIYFVNNTHFVVCTTKVDFAVNTVQFFGIDSNTVIWEIITFQETGTDILDNYPEAIDGLYKYITVGYWGNQVDPNLWLINIDTGAMICNATTKGSIYDVHLVYENPLLVIGACGDDSHATLNPVSGEINSYAVS